MKNINLHKKWEPTDIEYLIKNYADYDNNELSILMKRSISSIENKSHRLYLKKSREFKSKLIGRRNKMIGRDLNYENLFNIAKLYKTKTEFRTNDGSAYSTARINGYLDSICSHMEKINYSTPQILLYEIIKYLIKTDIILYNSRKIIPPYELDIYIPEYKLAFEYNGETWHENNKNDIIKKEVCDSANIKLIVIEERSRKYFEDIKAQLIENLQNINKKYKIEITDINNLNKEYLYTRLHNNIMDSDNIKGIISKYKNYTDFKKQETALYNKLCNTGTLKLFTNHLRRDKTLWTIEKIKTEINKYTAYSDFLKNSYGCYIHIKKNKLEYLLDRLVRNKIQWDYNKIKKLIVDNNYKTTYQIEKDFSGACGYLRKNKLVKECREFMQLCQQQEFNEDIQ